MEQYAVDCIAVVLSVKLIGWPIIIGRSVESVYMSDERSLQMHVGLLGIVLMLIMLAWLCKVSRC